MEIATLLYTIITLAICVAVYLALKKPVASKLNKHEIAGLKKLDELIFSVGGIDKVTFYTNGHPYVWVQATYEEMRNKVLFSCMAGWYFSKPASFLHKVDKESGAIYLVVNNQPGFEWSSLKHYEEWLNGNTKHAEAIGEYKKSQ